jgi:hypothetical protein
MGSTHEKAGEEKKEKGKNSFTYTTQIEYEKTVVIFQIEQSRYAPLLV